MANRLSIIALLFFNALLLSGQGVSSADLIDVGIEEGYINLKLKALEGGAAADLNRDEVKLIERYRGQVDTLTVQIIEKKVEKDSKVVERFSILFLVDLSSAIDEIALAKARDMVAEIFSNYESNSDTEFFLTSFNEAKIADRQALTLENLEMELRNLQAENRQADFNRILTDEIRFLKGQAGKKLLVVLGSGQNESTGLNKYDYLLQSEQSDIRRQLNDLDEEFVIMTIALGDQIDRDALVSIAASDVFYAENELPDGYREKLSKNVVIQSTHLAKAAPKRTNDVFRGEKRNYSLLMMGKESATISMRQGSRNSPISIRGKPTLVEWSVWLALGIVLIVLILGLCSVGVPLVRRNNFVNRYVKKYVPEGKVRLSDPVYNEPIEEGDLIVDRCRQVISLNTWKEIGWQCPNYPDCMDPQYLGCNGAGAPMEDSFFSRKGVFKQLNWMWFGAVGGFLAWLLYAILTFSEYSGIEQFAGLISNLKGASLSNLGSDLMFGITFGAGLMVAMAYIVGVSDSRQVSWGKIVGRTFLGILSAVLIFYFGAYLQYSGLLPNPYVSGLVSWLLFGVAIGLILSIKSNIVLVRGVLGGLVASLIAYNIYEVISSFFFNDIGAKLISLIVLGSVLGYVLVSVISRLESFELEFVAPKGYQTIPISKWLKNSQKIFIGKEPSNYVYIKWDDLAVLPKHAQLSYENGSVYIEPLAETLLNRKIIDPYKKIALKNKDLLQLGRDSTTIIRYRDKRVKSS